jgi:serine/threonine protein kinase
MQIASSANMDRRVTMEEREEFRQTVVLKRRDTNSKVNFEDFEILMVIGRGAFGKVFLAELKNSKKLYAIKSIRKDVLIELD